jgi:hypothetical protein
VIKLAKDRLFPDAVNDRLILIETISFNSTPDEMRQPRSPRGDPADHDGGADHVRRALLTSGVSGHGGAFT